MAGKAQTQRHLPRRRPRLQLLPRLPLPQLLDPPLRRPPRVPHEHAPQMPRTAAQFVTYLTHTESASLRQLHQTAPLRHPRPDHPPPILLLFDAHKTPSPTFTPSPNPPSHSPSIPFHRITQMRHPSRHPLAHNLSHYNKPSTSPESGSVFVRFQPLNPSSASCLDPNALESFPSLPDAARSPSPPVRQAPRSPQESHAHPR